MFSEQILKRVQAATESNIKTTTKIYRVWKWRNPERMTVGNRGTPIERAADQEQQDQENNSKTKMIEMNWDRGIQFITGECTMQQ